MGIRPTWTIRVTADRVAGVLLLTVFIATLAANAFATRSVTLAYADLTKDEQAQVQAAGGLGLYPGGGTDLKPVWISGPGEPCQTLTGFGYLCTRPTRVSIHRAHARWSRWRTIPPCRRRRHWTARSRRHGESAACPIRAGSILQGEMTGARIEPSCAESTCHERRLRCIHAPPRGSSPPYAANLPPSRNVSSVRLG